MRWRCGPAGRWPAPAIPRAAPSPGSARLETVKPVSPALGRPPRPVAPSSRNSPPEPVAAPGNGEIAVGWLWVSTFISVCTGATVAAYCAGRRVGVQVARHRALDHGRVVPVGAEHAARIGRRGSSGSSGTGCAACSFAVDDPPGIEDLVPAVLRIRLREHHQLGVGRDRAAPRRTCRRGSGSRPATAQGRAPRWRAPAPPRPRAAAARGAGAAAIRQRTARQRAPDRTGRPAGCSGSSGHGAAARGSDALGRPKGWRVAKLKRTPRSTRRTAASPQLRAISVALLDQGEIVPVRGTTQELRIRQFARRPPSRRRAGSAASAPLAPSAAREFDDVQEAGRDAGDRGHPRLDIAQQFLQPEPGKRGAAGPDERWDARRRHLPESPEPPGV